MSQTFLHHIVVRGTISALTMFSAITTISEQSFAISMSGFTGVYAPVNWTKSGAADGNVTNTNPDEAILQLDSGSTGQSIDYNISIDSSRAGTLQFDWQLESLDTQGNQGIGYLRNGNYTTLAVWAGNDTQSSESPVTVEVAQGDTFGFRFLALQDTSSQGVFTVNNFNFTPVPFETDALPAVISLSLFGAGVWLKRRKIR
jgi:hypothetical protein